MWGCSYLNVSQIERTKLPSITNVRKASNSRGDEDEMYRLTWFPVPAVTNLCAGLESESTHHNSNKGIYLH